MFESIELLQQSSGAFKVAVFMEAGHEGSVKGFDWAIEHCFSESSWLQLSERNWLEMASSRLRWAQEIYGATHLFAARNKVELAQELAAVGSNFALDRQLILAAQAHVDGAMEDACVSSLRGRLDHPRSSSEGRKFKVGNSTFRLRLSHQQGPVTLVSWRGEESRFKNEVERRGWNIVDVTEVRDMNPNAEQMLYDAVASAFIGSIVVIEFVDGPASLKTTWPYSVAAAIREGSGDLLDLEVRGATRVLSGGEDILVEMIERLAEADRLARALL